MLTGVASEVVHVSGLPTHTLRAGVAGPALVLLHGTAIDSARLTFGPSLPELGRHFTVYAPDLPGYGHSRSPLTDGGLPLLEEFLPAFIDAIGVHRAHLAGFSMGGGLALGYALDRPDQVDRLILIDSYGLGGTIHLPVLPYLALRIHSADKPVWWALRRNENLLRWFLAIFVLGDRHLASRQLVREVHEHLSRPGSEAAFMSWLRREIQPGLLRTNYRARLRKLQSPTLILHGARDLIVPAYRARRAARLVPKGRLVEVRGCGHWLPREAREVMEREIVRFLE